MKLSAEYLRCFVVEAAFRAAKEAQADRAPQVSYVCFCTLNTWCLPHLVSIPCLHLCVCARIVDVHTLLPCYVLYDCALCIIARMSSCACLSACVRVGELPVREPVASAKVIAVQVDN